MCMFILVVQFYPDLDFNFALFLFLLFVCFFKYHNEFAAKESEIPTKDKKLTTAWGQSLI